MKRTKLVALLLVAVLMVFSSPALAGSITKSISVMFNNINIEVNGEKVASDNILYEGTTYVPLRAVSDMLGKDVSWNATTKTAGINDKPGDTGSTGKIKLAAAPNERVEKSTEQVAKTVESIALIKVEDLFGDEGTGSGVFINSEGYLVTNYHVIADAVKIEVVTNETEAGKTYSDVKVINYDKHEDLALLKINAKSKGVFIEGTATKLGSDVIAIGNPLGYSNTVTTGIVSSHRDMEGVSYIQTSAPISPGSSGGALLNKYNELVGITVAKIVGGENMNLAIPSKRVLTFLDNSSESKRRIATLTLADGKYIGEVYNGKRHGTGKFIMNNGEIYIGHYENDVMQGNGEYFYTNGDVYSGNFEQGIRMGEGMLFYSNGDRYYGDFYEGVRDGDGAMFYGNGDYYRGTFVGDAKYGFGYYETDGQVYLGFFEDDMMTQEGMLLKESGEKIFGNFENGELVGQYAKFDVNGNASIYQKYNDTERKIK